MYAFKNRLLKKCMCVHEFVSAFVRVYGRTCASVCFKVRVYLIECFYVRACKFKLEKKN